MTVIVIFKKFFMGTVDGGISESAILYEKLVRMMINCSEVGVLCFI